MIDQNSIFESLADVGLSHGDTVLIHADAGVAAQLGAATRAGKLDQFVSALKHYFYEGTLLVPCFSYSATKREVFDHENTKSEVGLFSEFFRSSYDVERTTHPIFSFSVWGKNKDRFLQLDDTTCFGEGSLFDEFYKANGIVCCIGCSLDRMTFIHYVEQQIPVYYRYPKLFEATIRVGGSLRTIRTNYFVRDLEIDCTTDLTHFRQNALDAKYLKEASIGRFPIQAIPSRSVLEVAVDLYRKDRNSLIRQH